MCACADSGQVFEYLLSGACSNRGNAGLSLPRHADGRMDKLWNRYYSASRK